MKSRVLIDFLLILFVYLVLAGLIYGAVTSDWPGNRGVPEGNDAGVFRDHFEESSELLGGISLLCAFAWYILGEWGPRANKLSAGAWLAIWLTLFLVVIVAGVLVVIRAELGAIFLGENGWILAGFYLIWGPASYYVATVLFSPANTKYIVPGSGVMRRGW